MTSFRFTVGDFDVLMIRDGGSTRSPLQFLASAPPEELERIVRAQGLDPNAVENSITPIVIGTGSQHILVDTGLGGERGDLPTHLKENGLDPAEIDTIMITHGHMDHVGGILDANGAFVFPKADYVFWSTEWDYWTAEGRFDDSKNNPAEAVFAALKSRPDLIRLVGAEGAAEAEIMPGMCAVAAPGHTIGHIALELTSGDQKLLHIADAAHHWFQMQCPQWSPAFDSDGAQAAVTRQRLFERAAHDHSLLSAYHFPFPGIGHVVERYGSLVWQQTVG